MKKVFVIAVMFVLAFATNSIAQTGSAGNREASKPVIKEINLKLVDGSNTITVPDGQGTIKFTKRGDKVTEVVYTDAAGKSSRMQSSQVVGPKPCKCPIPDACYSIPNNQSIGMCICKACDLSSGNHVVTVWLPAVQKIANK
ncbi:MAG TPA: hypothetical protein VM488_18530 [Pseudobacter sp.]|nr:hypothetical protein [Pseudobacter sp.]